MPPISAKRKIDAVLTVSQNNANKSIDITAANKAASRLTGIDVEKLEQSAFTSILPDNLKETVESLVEFDDGGVGQDLATVLRKMFHFSIKKANGEIIPVSLKVFYVLSEDLNPCYELLMRDITLIKQLESLREQSLESQSHNTHIDARTGLAQSDTLKRSLDLVSTYMHGSGSIEATFVAVAIDNMSKLTHKYGDDVPSVILKQVGEALRKVCRAEDTVALIDDSTIGLVLLDCNHDDAQHVLNRYRLKLNNTAVAPQPEKADNIINITASFGFKEVKQGDTIENLIAISKNQLAQAQEKGGDRVSG